MQSSSLNSAALCDLSPEDALLFARFGVGQRQAPPFECIHHAFDHHAAAQPNAVAVEHCGESITYGELERRANTLALQLRSLGVVPGARVCLLVQRSISMVIGILAILKAGGAYVPLDGGIVTQSTLEHVIRDSESVLTLALSEYVHRVPKSRVFCLDDMIGCAPETTDRLENLSSPNDSAYIIYTSGTLLCCRRCTVLIWIRYYWHA